MAQPAPAPQITPSASIRIKNGVPDQDSVSIQVGEEVEFHNEDNTPYEIPLSSITGGSPDDYPLAVYLPAGGKFGLIGMSDSTCQYVVYTVPPESADAGGPPNGPPYTIIVGSGEPEARS